MSSQQCNIRVYFPEHRHLHGSETIQGETFPNLYTLRGTKYRDVAKWMEGVGVLIGYAQQADTYSGSHMRAWKGKDFIVERITNYRDAIQYVHDQTVYWMNLGYKRDQLPEKVVLPEPFASDPWLQEYYGTVAHSVRNIYNGYLGWWEADATQLAQPAVADVAKQYVRVMGGRDAVLAEGRKAVDAKNYGWAAEVLTHLTRVDPSDMDARTLKAEALRKWAYGQTNIFYRAYGISGAAELDGSIDRSKPWDFADPAIVQVLPTNQFLKTLSVRLNAGRAAGQELSVQFEVTDASPATGGSEKVRAAEAASRPNQAAGERAYFQVRNRVAAFAEGKLEGANATLRGSKQAIFQTISTCKLAEGVKVEGDASAAQRFLGLFDVVTPNEVNLLLTPGTALKARRGCLPPGRATYGNVVMSPEASIQRTKIRATSRRRSDARSNHEEH